MPHRFLSRRWRHGVILALTAVLAGCAGTPEQLRGDFPPLAPADADTDDIGTEVRWGGRVLSVTPQQDRTCLEILSLRLDRESRPLENGDTGRRFLACQQGFLDPAGFPDGRLVTVVGPLTGFETRPVGDYDYRFARLEADTIYLWAQRAPQLYYAPYPGYYDPFWRHDPFYRPRPSRLRNRFHGY